MSTRRVRYPEICFHATGPTVRLSAAKTIHGHAETGAGTLGILSALGLLECREGGTPILHLRTFSTYVAEALQSKRSGRRELRNSRSISISRQGSPDIIT